MVARIKRAALVLSAVAAAWATPAHAEVFQTDAAMTPLPQPLVVSEDTNTEWGLVKNAWAYNRATPVNRDAMGMNVNGMTFGDYYPTFENGDAITLGGLFKFRGENIDPIKDAKTTPGYFSPTCGFSGEIVLRGGDCEISFGWYNVEDPNSTTPPPADEIYDFLPTANSTLTQDLMCLGPLNNGFCPLAWDNVDPRQLDKKLWQRRAFDSGPIKEDPRYKGKYVGFAVRGKAGTKCTATKFSLQGHNTKNMSGTPWVTAIIYQSTVDPEGFYMAFEDLPMLPEELEEDGRRKQHQRRRLQRLRLLRLRHQLQGRRHGVHGAGRARCLRDRSHRLRGRGRYGHVPPRNPAWRREVRQRRQRLQRHRRRRGGALPGNPGLRQGRLRRRLRHRRVPL